MRLRSMLVASAFAASAVLGGAASASAHDYGYGHEHHQHHGIAAAGSFHKESSGLYYHNLGGPAGITDAYAYHNASEGWFGFMAR